MARGRWEDFADKYGFNDGDSVDTLDFAAREFLIQKLNVDRIMRSKKLKAVACNVAGVHNGARILILRDTGRIRRNSSIEGDLPKGVKLRELPSEMRDSVGDMVDASYDEAWEHLTRPRSRKRNRHRRKNARKVSNWE